MISELGHDESMQEQSGLPMSNFSTQYRQFKNQALGRSLERRNIVNLSKVQKQFGSSDIYYSGG